jgi:hypothetical protein
VTRWLSPTRAPAGGAALCQVRKIPLAHVAEMKVESASRMKGHAMKSDSFAADITSVLEALAKHLTPESPNGRAAFDFAAIAVIANRNIGSAHGERFENITRTALEAATAALD